MSNRITKRHIEAKFSQVCEAMGWSQEAWKEIDGRLRSTVGAVYIDHNPIYGGRQVHQMMNESGGVRLINMYRMKPSEFIAWCEGILLAKQA